MCPDYQFSTGVPQEFLKHAIPSYLVRGTDSIPLRLSNLKNDNSQHNNSPPVVTNENYTYFLSDQQKIYLLVCHRILVISLWTWLEVCYQSGLNTELCPVHQEVPPGYLGCGGTEESFGFLYAGPGLLPGGKEMERFLFLLLLAFFNCGKVHIT